MMTKLKNRVGKYPMCRLREECTPLTEAARLELWRLLGAVYPR
jgi:hypothetical protein